MLRPASRQRAQRRRLGRRAQARRCTLPGQGLTHLFSSGRSVRHAGGLRVPGSRADQICDPPAGQPGSAEQDRLSAQASGRTTRAPCAPVLCQFQLSGRNLDQAAEGYRQGPVASPRTLSPRRVHRDEHEPPGRHALAYNLGNFLRTLATPEPIKDWSLTTLKDKLIKIGAKVVSHGRYVVFQMAEVAIPRQMFQEILRLIAELRPQPPPASA